jgi:hypothetical protein
MIRLRTPRTLHALAALLVLGLMGCSRQTSDTTNTSNPPPTPVPAGVTVTTVEMGRGVGADMRVTERVTTFAPSDVIHASVITSGSAPSATLRARWTYQDGQVVDESERAIAPTGDAATEFHISKPDGLPAGNYRVEIFLDGVSVKTQDFQVQ